MWTKEKIADTFSEIVGELTEAAFDKDLSLRQEKLLGPAVGLKARDLVVLLSRIEDAFEVSIPDDFICQGDFDTYDHILGQLFQLLVK